jgi:hypothetical protein
MVCYWFYLMFVNDEKSFGYEQKNVNVIKKKM